MRTRTGVLAKLLHDDRYMVCMYVHTYPALVSRGGSKMEDHSVALTEMERKKRSNKWRKRRWVEIKCSKKNNVEMTK